MIIFFAAVLAASAIARLTVWAIRRSLRQKQVSIKPSGLLEEMVFGTPKNIVAIVHGPKRYGYCGFRFNTDNPHLAEQVMLMLHYGMNKYSLCAAGDEPLGVYTDIDIVADGSLVLSFTHTYKHEEE